MNGYFKIVLLLLFVVPAEAQSLNQNREEKCRGPLFSARELSQPARITSRQIPTMTQEAMAHDVRGRVVLEAVLCRNGRVTDLRVVESLPYGMTAKSLEAVRQIKFKPAEMNWHTVSQKVRFEFSFNETVGVYAKDAEGQIVRAVEIVGNRRLTGKEILELIKTRPGDSCSAQQLEKDLAAILATGYFDSGDTSIKTESSADGGVVVVIAVHELPLISEVKFEGLTGVAESAILETLRRDSIDLRLYDSLKIRTAISVIKKVLESRGQEEVDVAVRTDSMTATSVVLTFVITRK